MKHHLIYVPGLGDSRTFGQASLIKLWRLYGFTPHYFPLGWSRPEGLTKKLSRLSQKVKELEANGDVVSLVGVSAGASATLNAFANHPSIVGVVYICGKINHPENMGKSVVFRNPDFGESLGRLPESLKIIKGHGVARLLNMHPIMDLSVPPADTFISGSIEKIIPGWSHISGIFFGIVYGAPVIAKFLHSLEKDIHVTS